MSQWVLPRSLNLSAHGFSLHALERNPEGWPALLFLHGWLDHGHSFDWVCEVLPPDLRLVCLDFRGHGASAHHPDGVPYAFTDLVADADGAMEALGLSSAHLVGHSLGGSVAFALAAARPERVKSLTSIESLGTSGGDAALSVDRLRRYLEGMARPKRHRVYPSLEEAASRLREANSSLPPPAALHLARFGTTTTDGGVRFTFDPAHRRAYGMAFDEEQMLAVLGAVRCPVQVVHGSEGLSFEDAQARARLARLGEVCVHRVEGGHYLHLQRPAEVAVLIEGLVRRHS